MVQQSQVTHLADRNSESCYRPADVIPANGTELRLGCLSAAYYLQTLKLCCKSLRMPVDTAGESCCTMTPIKSSIQTNHQRSRPGVP